MCRENGEMGFLVGEEVSKGVRPAESPRDGRPGRHNRPVGDGTVEQLVTTKGIGCQSVAGYG